MRAHSVWQGERCDVMSFAAVALDWEASDRSPGAAVRRGEAAATNRIRWASEDR